jgi:hypothetical protein
MDWHEFIEKMVSHLSWPGVVLIVLFAVRKHLGSLAERILELSFGGATVKFDKLLAKGAELIEDAPPPVLPKGVESQPQGMVDIFSSYIVIENAASDLASLLGVKRATLALS